LNELIPINHDTEQPWVSARALHNALGIERRFSAWFETNSQGFIEGEDYTSVLLSTEVPNNGGTQTRELQDYNLSIDMAKHICLMSRTEKGKQCRQYLIDLEKAWNTPEQVLARALRLADKVIQQKDKLIEEMKPKAEFFDAVANSKTAIPMDQVAKVLGIKGIGRNKLFEILREKKVLDRGNVPYQEYVDRGYFRVIEQKYTKPNGDTCINIKTLVYQKGVDYIRKLIA